nr:hypothetical protein CFP56_65500 [Quercus suber]
MNSYGEMRRMMDRAGGREAEMVTSSARCLSKGTRQVSPGGPSIVAHVQAAARVSRPSTPSQFGDDDDPASAACGCDGSRAVHEGSHRRC